MHNLMTKIAKKSKIIIEIMLLVPFQVNLYLKEKSPPLLEATLLVVQTNPPDVFIMNHVVLNDDDHVNDRVDDDDVDHNANLEC